MIHLLFHVHKVCRMKWWCIMFWRWFLKGYVIFNNIHNFQIRTCSFACFHLRYRIAWQYLQENQPNCSKYFVPTTSISKSNWKIPKLRGVEMGIRGSKYIAIWWWWELGRHWNNGEGLLSLFATIVKLESIDNIKDSRGFVIFVCYLWFWDTHFNITQMLHHKKRCLNTCHNAWAWKPRYIHTHHYQFKYFIHITLYASGIVFVCINMYFLEV